MGKEPVEKIIEGEEYTFYYLDPDTSIDVLEKIIKLIGPSIGSAFSKEENINIKDIMNLNINIGDAIATLSHNISAKETKYIIKILCKNIFCKGRGKLSDIVVYNDLFTGNLKLLFKILVIAFEVQYGDFLEGNKET